MEPLIKLGGEPSWVYSRMLNDFDDNIDPRLRAIYLELSRWVWDKFKLPVIITCLNRTVQENDAVGGSKTSAHLSGRAMDIRTRYFQDDQIREIIEHLKYVWGDDFIYAIYHSGTGPHIHLNIRWKHARGNHNQ